MKKDELKVITPEFVVNNYMSHGIDVYGNILFIDEETDKLFTLNDKLDAIVRIEQLENGE